MQTVVRKWGNSLALRLPQNIAAELGVAEGATVSMSLEGERLVVAPARKRYKLADLLANAPPPAEVDWGKPEGEETW